MDKLRQSKVLSNYLSSLYLVTSNSLNVLDLRVIQILIEFKL